MLALNLACAVIAASLMELLRYPSPMVAFRPLDFSINLAGVLAALCLHDFYIDETTS